MAMTQGAAVKYTPKFAYVTNASAATVSAYSVNASTGALTPHPGGAVGTREGLPRSGTADPLGRFAYAANAGVSEIAAYTIGPADGGLTPIDANTTTQPQIENFETGQVPESITVEPSGRFLYTANNLDDNLSAFRINANGSLSFVQIAAAGDGPLAVTVDPAGKFAYAANFSDDSVSAYTIDGSTGGLTPIDADSVTPGTQNFPAGDGPSSVSVDPTGKFAYVANLSSDDISAYTVNAQTGALTQIPCGGAGCSGSNFQAGDEPRSVTVDPSGRFAYVANGISDDVSAYTINAATGALASIGPAVPTGIGARSVSVDASGKFAYVANLTTADVSIYTIDAVTGALTAAGTEAAQAGASSVTVTAAIQ
jgi:6-phosphogluconolactonase (cycloisomerase 2 family)